MESEKLPRFSETKTATLECPMCKKSAVCSVLTYELPFNQRLLLNKLVCGSCSHSDTQTTFLDSEANSQQENSVFTFKYNQKTYGDFILLSEYAEVTCEELELTYSSEKRQVTVLEAFVEELVKLTERLRKDSDDKKKCTNIIEALRLNGPNKEIVFTVIDPSKISKMLKVTQFT